LKYDARPICEMPYKGVFLDLPWFELL